MFFIKISIPLSGASHKTEEDVHWHFISSGTGFTWNSYGRRNTLLTAHLVPWKCVMDKLDR